MIRSRKGMLSTLDAVIFVTILAVVASAMAVVPADDAQGPDASSICTDLFDVRMPASCILPDSGDDIYGFADIAAIALSSGSTGFLEDYIERTVGGGLNGRYGYGLTLEYGGIERMFGDGSGGAVSSFSDTYDVLGDTDLAVTLVVYG